MQLNNPDPMQLRTQSAVLLVFMLSEQADRPQRVALTTLTDLL